MKDGLEINYEPPDGLLLSGRFCVGEWSITREYLCVNR